MGGSPLLGLDALPVDVTVGGRAFPIRHSFRDGIRFETMIYDASIPEPAKVEQALLLWFEPTVNFAGADLGDVIDALLQFYRCGKPMADDGDDSSEQLYSFEHDWDSIFSGFLLSYGINLLRAETDMHWWEFRSMLMGLPADTAFMRTIGYRAAEITPGMSVEGRREMAKMKRRFALPSESMQSVKIQDEETLRSVLDDIIAAKKKMLDATG